MNYYSPDEKCSVRYKDLDHVVKESIKLLENFVGEGKPIIWYGKSDLKSAFRVLPLFPGVYWLLILKARHPR